MPGKRKLSKSFSDLFDFYKTDCVRSHPIAAIFEEADQYDSHDNHNGHHNEGVDQSKEKGLSSTAGLILIERCVHTKETNTAQYV